MKPAVSRRVFVRERREDCGDGSDDSTEETEDHAGGRLYPDPAQSFLLPPSV